MVGPRDSSDKEPEVGCEAVPVIISECLPGGAVKVAVSAAIRSRYSREQIEASIVECAD